MIEKHYTFLVNNRVVDTYVFAQQDNDFATRICIEKNFDKFIWLDDKKVPARHSTYDKATNTFTSATLDYLYEIGVALENQAMQDERLAKEAKGIIDPKSVV